MSTQEKNDDDKVDPATRTDRRNAVKSILAGSGIVVTAFALPKRWTKPIVETVVVPAHGATSPPLTTTTSTTTSTTPID